MPKPDNLVALHKQMTGSYVVDASPLERQPLDKWAVELILKLQDDRERLVEALKQTTSELADEIRGKYSEADLQWPSQRRSYEADIAQIKSNEKLLSELEGGE